MIRRTAWVVCLPAALLLYVLVRQAYAHEQPEELPSECTEADLVNDDDGRTPLANACELTSNDSICHDSLLSHGFCCETVEVGCDFAHDCLGRCGEGCSDSGVGFYTLDCAEHDRCCRVHGGCLDPSDLECGDEFEDARDDFTRGKIFGVANCVEGCLPISITTTVTTLTDSADPPFDEDGLCPSTGTISNLPGADGLVSLREAIIAANNTEGARTITFDPSLSGGTIFINFDDLDADTTPDPLPLLCGGDTTINGDLNGDSVPDITLDGSHLVTETDGGIFIISRNNTVNSLRVQNFPGVGIGVFIPSTSNSTITNAAITDNEVLGNGFVGILLTPFQGDNNTITGVTIARNMVSGHNTTSLAVAGGWDGASGNIVDVTITENTVTGNSFLEGTAGIGVVGGILSSSGNQVTAQISNNTVVDNEGTGIVALASNMADHQFLPEEGQWLAEFYFNNAVFRTDVGFERVTRHVANAHGHEDINFLIPEAIKVGFRRECLEPWWREVRKEVNALKHRNPEALIKDRMPYTQLLQAIANLVSAVEWVLNQPAR